MTTNRIHAHVERNSQDCDGRYSQTAVYVADDDQTDDAFRQWAFDLFSHGATVSGTGGHNFYTFCYTEEGYLSNDVVFCTEDDTDEPGTFRDYTAEAAGY